MNFLNNLIDDSDVFVNLLNIIFKTLKNSLRTLSFSSYVSFEFSKMKLI